MTVQEFSKRQASELATEKEQEGKAYIFFPMGEIAIWLYIYVFLTVVCKEENVHDFHIYFYYNMRPTRYTGKLLTLRFNSMVDALRPRRFNSMVEALSPWTNERPGK